MKQTFQIAALTALVISPLQAQNDAAAVREKTEKAHLVGHEDELLLKRIDDAIAEWDPRKLSSPYVQEMQTVGGKKQVLRRPDLAEFIADPDAAIALGKAFFWDMQAGSDFGRKTAGNKVYGTACASCHYRFGADARSRNTETMAYQAWDKFFVGRPNIPNPGADTRVEKPPFAQRKLPFAPNGQQDIPRSKFDTAAPGLLQHEIVGSQGIGLQLYNGIGQDGIESSLPIGRPTWGYIRHDMFATGGEVNTGATNRTRQVTSRNSPSVINAVFNDRQFHDGRAESTFNGVSIFGDYDKRLILKKAFLGPDGKAISYEPISVAIVNASLGSQAVGPVVNEVEMSYSGRTFHDLAARLLKAQPLTTQSVNSSDSVLKSYLKAGTPGLHDPKDTTKVISYRQLIQRAFRKEWWADEKPLTAQASLRDRLAAARTRFKTLNISNTVSALNASISGLLNDSTLRFPADRIEAAIETAFPKPETRSTEIKALLAAASEWNLIESEILPLRSYVASDLPATDAARLARQRVDQALASMTTGGPNNLTAQDDLMVNNFSLYWGLAIMLYESTLISNESPFDQMMRGNPAGVNAVWSGTRGQTMTGVIEADGNGIKPAEPINDDTLRKAQLDKLITRAAPPVLTGTAMFQRGFRVFTQNCSECHPPPFFTSAAAMEADLDLPEPIAKLHDHSLIRTALADAFKAKLPLQGPLAGSGVDATTRPQLGNRRFFFDQERIPVVEETVLALMIENMGVPDNRPISFNTFGQPAPDRVPMITWADGENIRGTRPKLEYRPSPQPGEDPLEPYAFYDLGYYNLGVTEPRYDWGIWGYSGAENAISVEEVDAVVIRIRPDFPRLGITDLGLKHVKDRIKVAPPPPLGIAPLQPPGGPQPPPPGEMVAAPDAASIPSLGSAYRLPKARRSLSPAMQQEREQEIIKALQRASLVPLAGGPHGVDHSTERGYLDLGPENKRKDHHFFKRARRLVMTEESWGHRKPFISDNELMGWGAFKTPSLRNIALTEPYMHNGRFLTLRQVLKFYSFDNLDLMPANATLNPDLHPEMGRLLLNADGLIAGLPAVAANVAQAQDAEALLFFLHCLTDNRVRTEAAPFDHPSIHLVNGFNNNDPALENVITINEVGATGQAPPSQFPSNN